MSGSHYYSLCQRHMGKAVEIKTHCGKVHRGIIEKVSPNRVYMRPLDRGRGLGGFGFGFYGFGYGFGYGVALGAIASLAILPFFFW
ncbi:hypothetical protein CAI16_08260 [Virgibacillus dokdonensis]|uniref:Uncharacterized protein n=2 Tax=Virgibacillus TaxID=84406 RepID=A0A2K9J4Q5_9BACI|nr:MULTISPECIES: hypothetical protein [Virgibacillus]AUJ26919.1 hypothetical protein A21D_03885 [Virgibacillus dokdonensis]NWO13232.1 hypothetical protein [Virgibacillus sp.]RFA35477.1 hypothetical protein CAI16_08260 [Virgibacillus dokdonensis]SHG93084.1 hypothetical protein SAMN05421807_102345 [Virgibacillus chiguensis]